jgi:hypothetical protein
VVLRRFAEWTWLIFTWVCYFIDQKATRGKARKVLEAMVNPYVTLGMACLSPLLECINCLVKLAQARSSFICDFVAGLTCCQVQSEVLNSAFLFLALLKSDMLNLHMLLGT